MLIYCTEWSESCSCGKTKLTATWHTFSPFTSILTFNPFDVSSPHDSLYGKMLACGVRPYSQQLGLYNVMSWRMERTMFCLVKCGSAGKKTGKVREEKMRKYSAGTKNKWAYRTHSFCTNLPALITPWGKSLWPLACVFCSYYLLSNLHCFLLCVRALYVNEWPSQLKCWNEVNPKILIFLNITNFKLTQH